MRSLFAALMHLCGVAAVFASLWSFAMFIWVVSEGLVVWNASGYRRTVFTVAWVVFDAEDGSFAEGRVDGRHEIFPVHEILPRQPAGWDDLETMVKPGQRLDVLYNPGITRTSFQGRKLHLLPARGDFPASARRGLLRTALVAYGPLLIAVGACLGFGWAAGRSPWPWVGMAAFFLGGQVLFAALMVGVEASNPPPAQVVSPGPS